MQSTVPLSAQKEGITLQLLLVMQWVLYSSPSGSVVLNQNASHPVNEILKNVL